MVEVEAPKTIERLSAELVEAHKKKDWKAVSKLASAIAKLEAEREQAERDAKVKALEAMTLKVKVAIDKAVQRFIDSKELDVADGIWYSQDFGEKLTTCRLMKSAPKAKRIGGGTRTSSGESTADLMTKFGDRAMSDKDIIRSVDGREMTIKAGTTFKQAYELSSNGNYRFWIRGQLLKQS